MQDVGNRRKVSTLTFIISPANQDLLICLCSSYRDTDGAGQLSVTFMVGGLGLQTSVVADG